MDVSFGNPEPDENNTDPLRHTINRIETVVSLDLDKLAAGMIEELAPQTMMFMDRLASLSACLARQNPVFGVPETLHSDQGKELENQVVKELQSVSGYKKTRTAAYRPQGNSVLERVHSTVHNMLAMYSNLAWNNLGVRATFCYAKTLEETPHYLVFGRAAKLPVDFILGVPATVEPQCRLTRREK